MCYIPHPLDSPSAQSPREHGVPSITRRVRRGDKSSTRAVLKWCVACMVCMYEVGDASRRTRSTRSSPILLICFFTIVSVGRLRSTRVQRRYGDDMYVSVERRVRAHSLTHTMHRRVQEKKTTSPFSSAPRGGRLVSVTISKAQSRRDSSA